MGSIPARYQLQNDLIQEAVCTSPDLVVVPCGGLKLPTPSPAGELYVGSYHCACRRAAAALAPRRTLILSARHGLLELDQVIAPYDMASATPERSAPSRSPPKPIGSAYATPPA